jgi:hypothetical protein
MFKEVNNWFLLALFLVLVFFIYQLVSICDFSFSSSRQSDDDLFKEMGVEFKE